MADSDSEVSFESADEGEVTKGEQKVDRKTKGSDSKQAAVANDDSRTQDSGVSLRTEGEVVEGSERKEEKSDNKELDKTRTSEPEAESAKDAGKQIDGTSSADNVTSQTEKGAGGESVTSKSTGGGESDKKDGDDETSDGSRKGSEPVGEEIRDRGSTETVGNVAGAAGDEPDPTVSSGGAASGGSWGWGGWGSSLLTSAAATVTKVSDNVGKGLTSVLENVESTLGVPKPEELSESERKEAEQKGEQTETQEKTEEQSPKEASETGEETADEEKDFSAIGGFFTLGASALSSAMEKTVHGGLDALEAIGRKTMDILQEGDPHLERKRAFMLRREEKPNLSEVLRQAKDESEAEAARRQEEEEHQKYNFGFLFDQYQGLVHLEALEMLSNQSETRVQSSVAMVTDEDLGEVKTELLEIRDAFQMEDVDSVEEDATNDQDFVNVVTELLFSLTIAATPDKLQRAQKEAKDWLSGHSAAKTDSSEEKDEELEVNNIHARAMQTLAELTSRIIEQFHKTAELMLIDEEKAEDKTRRKSPVESATTLSKLASILTAEVSSIATRFCELLTSLNDQSGEASTVITNIYLEASNSTSYIQDAFQLLLPVMQDIAVHRRNASAATT